MYSLFVVTREDDDLESHSKLGILYSCWQQEKCMGASRQLPCISSFGTLAAPPGPDGTNGKAERH